METFQPLRLLCDWQVSGGDLPRPRQELEQEKPLPYIFGAPSAEHLNTPLEELDPYHQSEVCHSVTFDLFTASLACLFDL